MSDQKDFIKLLSKVKSILLWVIGMLIFSFSIFIYVIIDPQLTAFKKEKEIPLQTAKDNPDKIENGVHVSTGLVEAKGLMAVVKNCTSCHSSKLIIQNRMNEERWNATIKWMQETQNLWDLGENQKVIVDYLVTNYPPIKKGRRENLKDIDWYVLED